MADTVKSRKDDLNQHLKVEVLTLGLRPGSDLDEAYYAQQFALSRTPLREVFRQLAGDGYLEVHPNRGVRVAEMSHTSLRDFFLAAPMIYGAVLRLAALHATQAQLADLQSAQETFRKALASGSGPDRALANNRFHEITGEMCGNTYLLPSFQRLLIDHARISMTFYQPHGDPSSQSTAADHHDDIITAIANRDADAAAQLADAHWNLSRGEIESFVMPTPLDVPLGVLPTTDTNKAKT